MITYIESSATISNDRLYRYQLRRTWRNGPLRTATFIMFNPSTADALVDDRTIGRCASFAQSWGCDALKVVNLFAYRATNPRELLLRAELGGDAVGPQNDTYLRLAITVATETKSPLVVAWGTFADKNVAAAKRVAWVCKELAYQQAEAKCLKATKSGAPVHPLYQPADCELHAWPA